MTVSTATPSRKTGGRIPHRKERAVFADEEILAADGFPRPYSPGQRAFRHRIGRPVRLGVVDLVMHDLPDQFLSPITGHSLERRMDECPEPRCVDDIKRGRRIIGDGLEELHVVTQLFLRLLALRNVT